MCITFIKTAPTVEDKYKLILLNNRDENLHRPTLAMHWHDGILSGVDEQDVARGTWLGINEQGRIGNLLSITQPQHTKVDGAPSRGRLVHNFLKAHESSRMLEDSLEEAEKYNGFQFVGIEKNLSGLYDLCTLTNREVDEIKVSKWDDEFHVISNSPPHKPYNKVVRGKTLLEEHLQNTNEMSVDEIFARLLTIATDSTPHFPDAQLAFQTQREAEMIKPLSAIFIEYPDERVQYGTRSHTMIVVDRNDEVTVLERRLLATEKKWEDSRFEFTIKA